MSSVKYYYDPETLSYREVRSNKSTKLKYFFGFILSSALFGFLIVFVGSYYFESPNEKALKRASKYGASIHNFKSKND